VPLIADAILCWKIPRSGYYFKFILFSTGILFHSDSILLTPFFFLLIVTHLYLFMVMISILFLFNYIYSSSSITGYS